jgi:putative acyl-CoA dehydrogenase
MTTAAVPVLKAGGGPTARWVPGLTGADGARQLTAGMAMTEPQGGSDLGGSSTLAIEQGDGSVRISGHKWFVSHPVADVLLVLAREPGLAEGSRGLSCFAVPGWGVDGARNRIELQQLKDKLGTRSLASAEVMLREAEGERVGAPGEGIRTIIDMVAHTRMDCALGSTGIMSRAVLEAVHHARGRAAFGKQLVDQPLMRTVLADLALEREAALALSLEVARTFDSGEPLRRLVTAIAKYWVTRRAVAVAVEACEALGGNGYTEQFVVARLFRDAQVNSTWEGSGNVIVLDVFRALARDGGLATLFEQRVRELVERGDAELAERVVAALPSGPASEQGGRQYVGVLAMVLQAALLVDRATHTGDEADLLVARAFVVTRLSAAGGRVFGDGGDALSPAAEVLLQRACVER